MSHRHSPSVERRRKLRPSPRLSAAEQPVGKTMVGNDGNMYVIKRTAAGIKRWTRSGAGKRSVRKSPKGKKKSVKRSVKKSQKGKKKSVKRSVRKSQKGKKKSVKRSVRKSKSAEKESPTHALGEKVLAKIEPMRKKLSAGKLLVVYTNGTNKFMSSREAKAIRDKSKVRAYVWGAMSSDEGYYMVNYILKKQKTHINGLLASKNPVDYMVKHFSSFFTYSPTGFPNEPENDEKSFHANSLTWITSPSGKKTLSGW